MSKIQEVKQKLSAAINDAKRDGIILVCGGTFRYTDPHTGVTTCCLIGAALGDLTLDEIACDGMFADHMSLFSERYGITLEQANYIEVGFEVSEARFYEDELNEWVKLGQSFRRRARKKTQ